MRKSDQFCFPYSELDLEHDWALAGPLRDAASATDSITQSCRRLIRLGEQTRPVSEKEMSTCSFAFSYMACLYESVHEVCLFPQFTRVGLLLTSQSLAAFRCS